jgi:large subunit ribosomal protein L18
MKLETRSDYRKRRHLRLRQKVRGTAEKPRMSVFVSNTALFVQFVDDDSGRTLAAVSSKASALGALKGRKNVAAASELGRLAAEAALAKGLRKVVFDRGGFAYAGRIRALADAARKAGLEF